MFLLTFWFKFVWTTDAKNRNDYGKPWKEAEYENFDKMVGSVSKIKRNVKYILQVLLMQMDVLEKNLRISQKIPSLMVCIGEV